VVDVFDGLEYRENGKFNDVFDVLDLTAKLD